jgi:hypothetical protein
MIAIENQEADDRNIFVILPIEILVFQGYLSMKDISALDISEDPR